MSNMVAVYGTLRGNYTRWGRFSTKLHATTLIKGTMYNLGGFPGLRLQGDTDIVVEVKEVDDETLAHFDRIECYYENDPENSFYVRRSISIHPYGDVWIYEYNGNVDNLPIVKSGDWLNRGV